MEQKAVKHMGLMYAKLHHGYQIGQWTLYDLALDAVLVIST